MTKSSVKRSVWTKIARFLREVGRRHVLPVAAAYFVGSWLLIQVADVILPTFEAPPWILRAVLIATVVGFPITLLLAWIFDITPKGIVRAGSTDGSETSDDRQTSGGSSVKPDGDALHKSESSAARTVAVLPFVNRSPLQEDAFFADGIHDELLMHLAKLTAIQVISRTSVMRYRDTDIAISSIAKELGAAAILEGSVQRAGSRVRIIVQLIDGKDDYHLWAENFDRELTTDNLFDIQADITRLIAKQLEVALTSSDEASIGEAAPTQSLKAYDAYLRGQLLARSEAAGEEDIRFAIDAFDEAIALDPEFAEPYAGKTRAQLTLYWFFGWDKNWLDAAFKSMTRAKAISPEAIETLLAQAYYYYWAELNYPLAETALHQVLEKAPNNADAWACRAYVIRRAGQFSAAIKALTNAMRLNPMLIDLPMELAMSLATIGRFTEAHKHMDRVYALAPNTAFTAYYAGDIGYLEGDVEASWQGASIDVDVIDFVYCYRRAFHAVNTRNEKNMLLALEKWPDEFYRTASYPMTFEMFQAMIMIELGNESQAQSMLKGIDEKLKRLPLAYPGYWTPDAPYFPVTLPGLMRDRDAVQRATDDYEQNAPSDEFGKINHFHAIATAFAHVGDKESALDYLEKLMNLFGPSAYLPISIIPAYDGLREELRYLAFRASFESSSIGLAKVVSA